MKDGMATGGVDISDVVGDLSFLFLDGGRHSLAVPGEETTACVPIAGCPDLCGG